MREVKRLFYLFILIFMLTGCTIKEDYDMIIDKDGKMKLEILLLFDKDLLTNVINYENESKGSLIEISDDMMKSFVNDPQNVDIPLLSGLTKYEFSDEKYIGNKYVYNIDHIDKISSNEEIVSYFNLENEKLIDKKLFYKDNLTYNANFKFDNLDLEGLDYIVKFKVVLPNKAIENNAHKISSSGKTLLWNLDKKDSTVKFSFKLNNDNEYFIISIIGIIFVIVTSFYFLIYSRKGAMKHEK